MTIQVSKQVLVFQPPLGSKELHLLKRVDPKGGEYKGALVVLSEVHGQLFSGDDTPLAISTTTFTRKLGGVSKHYWELCGDRSIISCLAQQSVIKSSRAPHLLLLSLSCLVSLMHELECPQAMITPVKLLKSRQNEIMQACTLHLPLPHAPPLLQPPSHPSIPPPPT